MDDLDLPEIRKAMRLGLRYWRKRKTVVCGEHCEKWGMVLQAIVRMVINTHLAVLLVLHRPMTEGQTEGTHIDHNLFSHTLAQNVLMFDTGRFKDSEAPAPTEDVLDCSTSVGNQQMTLAQRKNAWKLQVRGLVEDN